MESIIDNDFIRPNVENQNDITYGGFWIRTGALFVDGIIIGVLVLSLMYFNATQWKSVPVLILLSFMSVAYKPFCEFKYGATVGKMACNLGVVNCFDDTLKKYSMYLTFYLIGNGVLVYKLSK
jgi:uncharacterized RDD family membrane protein YckC